MLYFTHLINSFILFSLPKLNRFQFQRIISRKPCGNCPKNTLLYIYNFLARSFLRIYCHKVLAIYESIC